MENDGKRRTNFPVDKQFVSETSFGSNCEKKADAASGSQSKIFTGKQQHDLFPCYCLLADSKGRAIDKILEGAFF